jgi:hypothetical protein
MDYKELLEKYNILLEEKKRLSEENSQLKALLGPAKLSPSPKTGHQIIKNECADELAEKYCFSSVDSKSDTVSKIRLFMSLFKGREDVTRSDGKTKAKAHRDTHLFAAINGKKGYAVNRASHVLNVKTGRMPL